MGPAGIDEWGTNIKKGVCITYHIVLEEALHVGILGAESRALDAKLGELRILWHVSSSP